LLASIERANPMAKAAGARHPRVEEGARAIAQQANGHALASLTSPSIGLRRFELGTMACSQQEARERKRCEAHWRT
jgi:hypothetical protein